MSHILPLIAVEPENELRFSRPFSDQSTATMIISSMSYQRICFKVETKRPGWCTVKPITGVLNPHCRTSVTFTLLVSRLPFNINDPAQRREIKFRVLYVAVPEGMTNLDNVWNAVAREDIHVWKLTSISPLHVEAPPSQPTGFRVVGATSRSMTLQWGPPSSSGGAEVTAPPSQPTNFRVVDVTSRSVTLQWGPPSSSGGAEVTGYIVEKKVEGTDKWEKIVTLDSTVTLYVVHNLKERSDKLYFRVTAENPIGLSEPAETGVVALKTHATAPGPPTAPLEIRPTGPHSIIVEWGEPESDGGAPIEEYVLAARDTRKTMWMEVGTVEAGVTRLNIKDMQESHSYDIRVFARNEVGLSEPLESEEPIKVIRPPVESVGLVELPASRHNRGTGVVLACGNVIIPGIGQVIDVAAGGLHSVILTTDGGVYTFGNNDEGALGRPTEEEDRFEARKVLLPGKVCMISAGDAHSAALLQDGRVFAWGIFKSASGDLGLIPTSSAKVESPVEILPLILIKKIGSGENHMVLLSETGHVYTFGCPEQGQLGRLSSRAATIGSSRLTVAKCLEPQKIVLRTDKPRRKEVALFDDVWAGRKATYIKIKNKDQIYVCGLNNRMATESAIQYFPILTSLSERAITLAAAQHHNLTISLNELSIVSQGRRANWRRCCICGWTAYTNSEEIAHYHKKCWSSEKFEFRKPLHPPQKKIARMLAFCLLFACFLLVFLLVFASFE